jgi:PKD repeat protein
MKSFEMKIIITLIFCMLLAQQIFAIDVYSLEKDTITSYPGEKDTITSLIFSSFDSYMNFRDFPDFLEFKTLEVYWSYWSDWHFYYYYIQFELIADNNAPFVDSTFYIDFEFTKNGANARFDTVAVFVNIQNPNIIAGFTSNVTEGSNPLTVSFTNTSTGKYSGLFWDFGDGETSSEENSIHEYVSTGTFPVQLIASNETSADTFLQENYIRVFNMPTGLVSEGGGICPGDSAQIVFSFTGTPPWDFTWSNGTEQFNETTSDTTFVTYTKTESNFFLVSLQDANDTTVTIFNDTAKVWLNPVPEKPGIFYEESIFICEGEIIHLNAPVGFDIYRWTNGSNTEIVEVAQSMQIAVQVANQFGCLSDFSDTLEIEVYDLPTKPVITHNIDTLETQKADSIQWYLNADAIAEGTTNKLEINKSGNYFVKIFNENRCSNVSDEMFYVYSESSLIVMAEDEFQIMPNPFSGKINVYFSGKYSDLISWELIQLDGKVIKFKNIEQTSNNSLQISTTDMPAGIYFLRINSINKKVTRKLVKY